MDLKSATACSSAVVVNHILGEYAPNYLGLSGKLQTVKLLLFRLDYLRVINIKLLYVTQMIFNK